MNEEEKIKINIEPKVYWKTPPKTKLAEIARDQFELRLKMACEKYAEGVEHFCNVMGEIGPLGPGKPEVSMSEKKWTPEPWHCTPQISGGRKEWPIYKTEGRFAHPAKANSQEDADRIINCVNAMVGIQDPKAFVEKANKLNEKILSVILSGSGKVTDSLMIAQEDFDKARKGGNVCGDG